MVLWWSVPEVELQQELTHLKKAFEVLQAPDCGHEGGALTVPVVSGVIGAISAKLIRSSRTRSVTALNASGHPMGSLQVFCAKENLGPEMRQLGFNIVAVEACGFARTPEGQNKPGIGSAAFPNRVGGHSQVAGTGGVVDYDPDRSRRAVGLAWQSRQEEVEPEVHQRLERLPHRGRRSDKTPSFSPLRPLGGRPMTRPGLRRQNVENVPHSP